MSSAGHFNTPPQILPKDLKWQEDVVVPEHFSTDEILELKKWSRITGDENSGYEPVSLPLVHAYRTSRCSVSMRRICGLKHRQNPSKRSSSSFPSVV